MCLHQGKTPADQADGDSELATYLSTQKHPSSTTNEDLETAVWGSHTLTHTHSASLDSHTRSGDESEREKCKKKTKKKEIGLRRLHRGERDAAEEWTASAHSSTAVEILMVKLFICIYLFIFYLLVVLIDRLSDWL